MSSEVDRIAPEGAIWVCAACGKTAKDRYGLEGDHSRGWDESCMLNAILCNAEKRFSKSGLFEWQVYTPLVGAPSAMEQPS